MLQRKFISPRLSKCKWLVFYCRNRSIYPNNVCYSREIHIMARGVGAGCVNSATIFGNRYSHSERPQLLSQSCITQCTVTYDARMDEFSAKFVSSPHCARRIYSGVYLLTPRGEVRFPTAFCPYYRTRRKHSTPCCLFARPHRWNMQSLWYQREKSRFRSTTMLGTLYRVVRVTASLHNFVPKIWTLISGVKKLYKTRLERISPLISERYGYNVSI